MKNITEMTSAELRKHATSIGIKNSSKYRKEVLLEAVLEKHAEQEVQASEVDAMELTPIEQHLFLGMDVVKLAPDCYINGSAEEPTNLASMLSIIGVNKKSWGTLLDAIAIQVELEEMSEELKKTKSEAIREFLRRGYSRASIARAMNIRYQMVREIDVKANDEQ